MGSLNTTIIFRIITITRMCFPCFTLPPARSIYVCFDLRILITPLVSWNSSYVRPEPSLLSGIVDPITGNVINIVTLLCAKYKTSKNKSQDNLSKFTQICTWAMVFKSGATQTLWLRYKKKKKTNLHNIL